MWSFLAGGIGRPTAKLHQQWWATVFVGKELHAGLLSELFTPVLALCGPGEKSECENEGVRVSGTFAFGLSGTWEPGPLSVYPGGGTPRRAVRKG